MNKKRLASNAECCRTSCPANAAIFGKSLTVALRICKATPTTLEQGDNRKAGRGKVRESFFGWAVWRPFATCPLWDVVDCGPKARRPPNFRPSRLPVFLLIPARCSRPAGRAGKAYPSQRRSESLSGFWGTDGLGYTRATQTEARNAWTLVGLVLTNPATLRSSGPSLVFPCG